MTSHTRRKLLQAAGMATLLPRIAHAQAPTRFVVAFAAGGIADTVARLVAQRLNTQLGRSVIVENRGGAGGNVAAGALMTAPAGGSTFLVHTAAFAINASMSATPGYDPKAYVPICLVATTPEVLAAHPGNPAGNLQAFVQRNKGRQISYSTAGVGSSSHLTGEFLLRHLGGIDALHVPYQGGAPAIVAALSNQVSLVVTSLPPALQHIRAGRLTAIAVTGARRTSLLPEVPTALESGFKLESQGWVGILAPPGTPPDVAQRMNADINAVLGSSEVKEKLESLSFDPVITSTDEFGSFIRSEIDKWGNLVRTVGVAQSASHDLSKAARA
jgi:tripartite-type tricarboxylate transporter receptor subunit TctC